MKELCNNSTCHEVKEVKQHFYRHLPDERAVPLMIQGFKRFRRCLQPDNPCMDRNCGPLIELISRQNELRKD